MIDLSVIIPVYRTQDILPTLYERIVKQLTQQELTFELIFIEDCGGDDSWNVIQKLAVNDKRVRGLKMSRNYGQHNALLAGILAANGKLIATMDDDLQHPPEELPVLFRKLSEGYDVVYGSPKQEQHGLFRNLASQITKFALQNAMGAETARHISAFRLFRAELRGVFATYKSPAVNIDVLLTWATTKFSVCIVRHDARRHGESGYNSRKLLRHAMNMITGFSTLPLKVAGLIGLMFAAFGALILAYILVRYITIGTVVPGFAFLASIIALFSGAQLLALGIIGEYLSRMYQRTMERPAYLVRETTEDAQ